MAADLVYARMHEQYQRLRSLALSRGKWGLSWRLSQRFYREVAR